MSSFKNDLKNEGLLAPFLDTVYTKRLNCYTFERISKIEQQLEGVDLIFTQKTTGNQYCINEDLPTFAFELSYLKNKKEQNGWLFDQNKKTDFYALVTAIFQDDNEYSSCKITLVNRKKLIVKLSDMGFQAHRMKNYRRDGEHGKVKVPFLNPKTQGYLYWSKNNKAEQPLNLIIRLEWLLRNNLAKRLI